MAIDCVRILREAAAPPAQNDVSAAGLQALEPDPVK
jgi:hypothetical protein